MPAKQKSVEDIQADNADAQVRLAEKRERLRDLASQQTADAATLEAEMQSRLLAEEEARIDAELAVQEKRTGLAAMRKAAPELSSEYDKRVAAEQEEADKVLARAATVVHESAGTKNPEGKDAVPAASPEQAAAGQGSTTSNKEKA